MQRYKASPDKPFFCHAIASTLKRLVRQVPGGFLDRISVQRIREVEVFQRTGRSDDEEEDLDNVRVRTLVLATLASVKFSLVEWMCNCNDKTFLVFAPAAMMHRSS